MDRRLLPLALVLAACAAPRVSEPLAETRATPAPAEEAAAPAPATIPAAGAPEPVPPPVVRKPDPPLPHSFVIGASMTHGGKNGGPPVTVDLRDGTPVPWTESEVRLLAAPLDPSSVTSEFWWADLWTNAKDEPETVRLGVHFHGLPPDVLFIELLPTESSVEWADGSLGGFRSIHSQYVTETGMSLDVLTTVPPTLADIRSVVLAVNLHRWTRAKRHVASVGVGEVAVFNFGNCVRRWFLAEDLEATEFEVTRHADSILPLSEKGLRPFRLATLTDATGHILQDMGSGGSGSVCHREWGFPTNRTLAPPLLVTVDLPLETVTTKVVVRLKDIHPKK